MVKHVRYWGNLPIGIRWSVEKLEDIKFCNESQHVRIENYQIIRNWICIWFIVSDLQNPLCSCWLIRAAYVEKELVCPYFHAHAPLCAMKSKSVVVCCFSLDISYSLRCPCLHKGISRKMHLAWPKLFVPSPYILTTLIPMLMLFHCDICWSQCQL